MYVNDVASDNAEGSFNAEFSVNLFCMGIKGVDLPAFVEVGIDNLIIVPA